MNATISLRILALVARGVPLPDAIDAVLGAGTYTQIVGDVYDALREVADRG